MSGTIDSSDVERQYLWGQRYVDDLIARDRDTTGNGTLDERLYALQDANFNVTAILDDTGAVLERYRYTPYGQRTVLDDDWSDDADGVSDYAFVIGHQGLMYDAESGLVYNRWRMLHVMLGRFMQRDPLGYVDGMSAYEYLRGNVIRHGDPFGTNSAAFDFPVPSVIDFRGHEDDVREAHRIHRRRNEMYKEMAEEGLRHIREHGTRADCCPDAKYRYRQWRTVGRETKYERLNYNLSVYQASGFRSSQSFSATVNIPNIGSVGASFKKNTLYNARGNLSLYHKYTIQSVKWRCCTDPQVGDCTEFRRVPINYRDGGG